MGSFSVTHWAILLAVVVIVFGTSKLKNAGSDLGGALKGFKDAVKEESDAESNSQTVTHQIDHDAVASVSNVSKQETI